MGQGRRGASSIPKLLGPVVLFGIMSHSHVQCHRSNEHNRVLRRPMLVLDINEAHSDTIRSECKVTSLYSLELQLGLGATNNTSLSSTFAILCFFQVFRQACAFDAMTYLYGYQSSYLPNKLSMLLNVSRTRVRHKTQPPKNANLHMSPLTTPIKCTLCCKTTSIFLLLALALERNRRPSFHVGAQSYMD